MSNGHAGSQPAASWQAALPTRVSPFGLATSAEAWGEYARYLPKLKQIGVRALRGFSEWRDLQPSAERFDFARQDANLAALDAYGIEASGLFLYGAAWTRSAGGDKALPTGELAAWKRYVGAVVGRYRGRIRYWEVWNEPNAPAFNRGNHTPADYARLVNAARSEAKRADPRALVGITCASFDLRYLKLVVEALARASTPDAFDFIAVHPYELLAALNEPDGELLFLSIAGNVRAMLRETAPRRADVPIRLSELGVEAGSTGDGASEIEAASLLIKAYTLGIAQGVEQLEWFEAMDAGGSRGFGLLSQELEERAAYRAYGAISAALGAAPNYRGWLALGDGAEGYGFVFGSGKASALVAWMPKGKHDVVRFPDAVEVVDIFARTRFELPGETAHVLTERPLLFKRVPEALVRHAHSQRDRPYPWGSAPARRELASIALGPGGNERGIRQLHREIADPYVFADGSTGARVNVGRGNALGFALHPAFADYDTRDVYVRVSARTTEPTPRGRYTGMNLWYQPRAAAADQPPRYPYEPVGPWWSVPDDQQWHTMTWHLRDAMFVHTFGHSFSLSVDESFPFVIGKVEISKVPF